MKKFFTFLAMAAIGFTAANAETVTAEFQTYTNADGYQAYYKPFELEIVKNEDGSYSMPNFMNSGSTFSFSFDEPKVGKSAEIKILSPNEDVATAWEWGEGYEDWYALLDEKGDALELSGETTDGATKIIYDPIVITADGGYLYAYVKKLDTTDGENEYQYYADFNFCGYPEDNEEGDYFYLQFYFGKVEENVSSAETVTADFQTYTNADGYKNYYKPFELEIVKNEDGSYSMPNFMNSGSAFSFSFNEPKVGKSAEIKITSPIENVATAWEWGEGYEDYYALLDENGDALELSGETTDGVTKIIYDPVVVTADDGYLYAYVKKLDTTDGENEYQYYADFCILGYPEDNDEGDWFYLQFYFGKADNSAVNAISVDENAPVEFYNLNGMRVENPSNGIFIRKQGNDVKKIVVRK